MVFEDSAENLDILYYGSTLLFMAAPTIGIGAWVYSSIPNNCDTTKLWAGARGMLVLGTIILVVTIGAISCAFFCTGSKTGINGGNAFLMFGAALTNVIFTSFVLQNGGKCISKSIWDSIKLYVGIVLGLSVFYMLLNLWISIKALKNASKPAVDKKRKVTAERRATQARKRQAEAVERAQKQTEAAAAEAEAKAQEAAAALAESNARKEAEKQAKIAKQQLKEINKQLKKSKKKPSAEERLQQRKLAQKQAKAARVAAETKKREEKLNQLLDAEQIVDKYTKKQSIPSPELKQLRQYGYRTGGTLAQIKRKIKKEIDKIEKQLQKPSSRYGTLYPQGFGQGGFDQFGGFGRDLQGFGDEDSD